MKPPFAPPIPPEVEVRQAEPLGEYELAGWSDFDIWATRNLPMYHAITKQCMHSGISDGDRLRLLVNAFARANCESNATTLKYAERYGPLPQ